MSAPAPEYRVTVADEGVRIAQTVRAVHWVHTSGLNNWIAGRGRPLVPSHSPLITVASGTAAILQYRVRPSYQHVRLRAEILVSASAPSICGLALNSVVLSPSVTANVRGESLVPFVYEATRASRIDAEETVRIAIAVAENQPNVLVEGIAVEALPRAFLDTDANDLGSDRLMFWPRTPFSVRNYGENLLWHQTVLKRSARRAMFQFAWGDETPWSMAAAGPVDVFDGGFGLVGRYIYEGDTERELAWRVRARCSDDTTSAEVTVAGSGGGTGATITVPAGSTTSAWFPALDDDPSTFTCDAEDPSHARGLRGGAVDLHQVSVERTAGSGTVYLESVSIWESPDGVPPAPSFYRITTDESLRETTDGDLRIVTI